MTKEEFALCLRLFDEAMIVPLVWRKERISGAEMYVGRGNDLTIYVVKVRLVRADGSSDETCPIGYEGFTTVHMTREVAERLFKRAEREIKEGT